MVGVAGVSGEGGWLGNNTADLIQRVLQTVSKKLFC